MFKTCSNNFLLMSFWLDLQTELLEHGKSMPEAGKAEDSDFEVWGVLFCEKFVSLLFFDYNSVF